MEERSVKTDQALILKNEKIPADTFRIILKTDIAEEVQCGQFVQVQVPGFYLRRPISVCMADEETLTLVYKTVGDGTKAMSEMEAGQSINLFGPLGHGFPVEKRSVLLIGGGVGTPPLLLTAKKYIEAGQKVTAVLGYNDKASLMLEEEFRELGASVYAATMDGSCGTQGTVLDAIRENGIEETYVLACGPLPMLKAVSAAYSEGCVSLESRMACGMGACMGCVVKDQNGESMRVCKDGPVFEIGKAVL